MAIFAYFTSAASQRGISLIELMLAISLSMLLSLGVLSFHIQQKTSYLFQQGLSRILQNSQIAAYTLKNALQSAGSLGCLSLVSSTPMRVLTATPLPIEADMQLLEQYNRLLVQKAQAVAHKLLVPMSHIQAPITVERGKDALTAGDMVVVSDCQQADVFMVNDVSVQRDTRTLYYKDAALSKAYDEQAELSKWTAKEFYIADSHYKNLQDQTVKGLFVHDLLTGHREEIVQGVEAWQLRYGLDRNNDGLIEEHRLANEVRDWLQVKSVAISLLLNSIDNVLPAPKDYEFAGKHYSATDRLLRKQVDIYIALRNR